MAYTKTNWTPGETPLSADNLNNIENGIESVESRLNSTIVLQRVNFGKTTVNANAGYTHDGKLTKSGYSAAGIVGYSSAGSNAITVPHCSIDINGNYGFFLRNHSSSAATLYPYINVLWVKTESLK
jgi:hypothetical protein